ncbi:MAG: Rnase Y domain-containing protein, partial [Bacteroidales bacterium]
MAAFIGAGVALAAYILARKIILKGRKDDILDKAEIEAESLKKDKILQAKEKFIQLKSEYEKYVNDKNSQLKDNENRIKQKENSLNQQNADMQRKIKD